MTRPAIDIAPEHRAIVEDLLKRHVPDRDVWAFGSRVAGRAGRYSDLDLAVMGESPVPGVTLADLRDDLRESDLPFKVDILEWATTSAVFREIVRKDAALVQSGTAAHELAGVR